MMYKHEIETVIKEHKAEIRTVTPLYQQTRNYHYRDLINLRERQIKALGTLLDKAETVPPIPEWVLNSRRRKTVNETEISE